MMFDAAVSPSLQGIERARHLLACLQNDGREALLASQLAPNMFNCGTQLQTVGIFALRATFPLVGKEWPKDMFDVGSVDTALGLDARLAVAESQVRALTRADFEGAATRVIRHVAGDAHLEQTGKDYLMLFALPNLWFHLSMAFAILRHEGLEVGKADFDGWHAYAPGFSFVAP